MLKIRQLFMRLRKSKKGFTLIEIVAVMAIIGVLSVALVPSIEAAIDRSNDTKLKVDLTNIDTAAKVYKLDKGSYPTNIAALKTEKYLPDKEYKGVDGEAIAYDAAQGFATGVDSRGNTVKADGTIVEAAGQTP